MKKLLLYNLILLILSFIGCQDDRDAVRLIDRAEFLLSSNPDSSRILLDSIAVPDKLSDKQLAHWCMLYGEVADTLAVDLPYTLQLQRADSYYKSHGTPLEQARIALYLGRAYLDDENPEMAMKTYLDALQTALTSNHYNQAGYICSYMGDLYDFDSDYLLAVNKYKEAECYFRKAGNLRSAAFALRDAGRMYAISDSLELALNCLHKADTIAMHLGDTIVIGSVNNGLGNVYQMMGELEMAEKHMLKGLQYNTSDKAPDYLALSGLYFERGNNEKVREYLRKADIPTSNAFTSAGIIYTHYLLEKKENKTEKSLYYLEKYNQMSDSIENQLKKENIFKVEKEYNYLKISLDNIRLKSDKQWMFILIMILVILFMCLIIIYFIRINKKNKYLYKQELEIKEKDIVLLYLKEELQVRQKELNNAFERMKSLQQLGEHNKMEMEYARKQEEIKIITKKIAEQQLELLFCSPIAKKITKFSNIVNPGQEKSPLSEKDWATLFSKVDAIYPSLRSLLVDANMTDAELYYSYLSLFKLDVKGEAVLLNINPDSVNKRRQRVRQKLGIIGLNEELGAYLLTKA